MRQVKLKFYAFTKTADKIMNVNGHIETHAEQMQMCLRTVCIYLNPRKVCVEISTVG